VPLPTELMANVDNLSKCNPDNNFHSRMVIGQHGSKVLRARVRMVDCRVRTGLQLWIMVTVQ
jgi:hypothetical protein